MPRRDTLAERVVVPTVAEVTACPRWWFRDRLGNVVVIDCYVKRGVVHVAPVRLAGLALAAQPAIRLHGGEWLPCPEPEAFRRPRNASDEAPPSCLPPRRKRGVDSTTGRFGGVYSSYWDEYDERS